MNAEIGENKSWSKGRVWLLILILASPLFLNDVYKILIPRKVLYETWLWLKLDILFYIVFQSAILIVYFRKKYFSWREIGLSFDNLIGQIKIGLLITAPLFVLLTMPALVNKLYFLSSGENLLPIKLPDAPRTTLAPAILCVLYMGLSAGFFEEAIYRGFVINRLRSVYQSKFLCLAISAVIFGVIHWSSLYDTSRSVIAGLFFGLLYLSTKQLLPLMIAHALFDMYVFSGFERIVNRFLGLI